MPKGHFPRKRIDLLGQNFGRWVVIEEVERGARGNVRWLCRCECGFEKVISTNNLVRAENSSKSCGCIAKDARSARLAEISERKFGRWQVIGTEFAANKSGSALILCKCECGKEGLVNIDSLKNGKSQSCGCLARELWKKQQRTIKHGHTISGPSPEYNSWKSMCARCLNPNNPAFKYYGGKGVEVCERWLKFESFLADMGERPKGTSLDRIDVNEGYYPSNARWATQATQSRNRTNNVYLTHNGKTQVLRDWIQETGLPSYIIKGRLAKGWGVSRALTTPYKKRECASGEITSQLSLIHREAVAALKRIGLDFDALLEFHKQSE